MIHIRGIKRFAKIAWFSPYTIYPVADINVGGSKSAWSVTHDIELLRVRGKQRFNFQIITSAYLPDYGWFGPVVPIAMSYADIRSNFSFSIETIEVHGVAVGSKGRFCIPFRSINDRSHIGGARVLGNSRKTQKYRKPIIFKLSDSGFFISTS